MYRKCRPFYKDSNVDDTNYRGQYATDNLSTIRDLICEGFKMADIKEATMCTFSAPITLTNITRVASKHWHVSDNAEEIRNLD